MQVAMLTKTVSWNNSCERTRTKVALGRREGWKCSPRSAAYSMRLPLDPMCLIVGTQQQYALT